MSEACPIQPGDVVSGPLFHEPMRVETVSPHGAGTWVVGMVGRQTERFRRVTLAADDIQTLTISKAAFDYGGEGPRNASDSSQLPPKTPGHFSSRQLHAGTTVFVTVKCRR